MVKDIKSIIEEKCSELTNCRDNCEGIICDDTHLPRCLFYEDEERDKSKLGCIIVGLNPGEANEDEIKKYKENPTYKTVREYWKEQTTTIIEI